jgi:predicted DNA-binding WGR domain protein
MTSTPRHLYIERRDAARNMARFYALSIEPTLFGDICLTRRWGRIGTRGQMRAMSFSHEDEALAQFVRIQRQKASRGYRECPT